MSPGTVRKALCASVVLAALPAAGATLTRGPYLQLLTSTSVTVVWKTDVPAACGLSVAPVGGSPVLLSGPTGTLCAVPIGGLGSGGQYGYVPLADGAPLAPESVFRTPDASAPFTFVVMGDHGCGCAEQLTVRDRLLATPADFILSTGDMIYKDGAAADFDGKFFVPYAALIRRLVFWPLLGNHDIHSQGGAPWRDAFWTPANNPEGAEHYYSFDYGNAHVAVIDSNSPTAPGSAQYRFLDQDLAASTATWNFVAFHHSMYTNGGHSSATALRKNLVPLFDQHRVDVVFAGHSHDYERTFPLQGDRIVAAGQGTVYVTTGGGGADLDSVGPATFTAYAEQALHFSRVTVDGSTLSIAMIRADGVVRDSITLTKSPPGPPGRCGDGVVALGEQCDDGNGADGDGCDSNCTVTRCGNGVVTGGEQCDDGNALACDGCSATCQRETDLRCLGPLADTFIDAGAEKTWDHGRAAFAQVDASPTQVAYLKFDLRAVSGLVRSATLRLFWGNSSPDGGTVYPVSGSGWNEGSGNGRDSSSAGGPGLKWTDVDTNGDGVLDARDGSPYLPDFTRPVAQLGGVGVGDTVSVDVTSAFQGGPALYTIALRGSSSDGGTFYSREHPMVDNRPQLVLQVTPPCTRDADCDDGVFCNGTETCASGSCRSGVAVVCDDGIACTTDRCDEATRACKRTPDATRCIDGDPCTADACDVSAGCMNTPAPCEASADFTPIADTYVESATQATWDHGGADHLDVDQKPVDVAYLKFDLSRVSVPVQRATLTLHCTNTAPDGGTVYPVRDSSWIEGTATGLDAASANGNGLKWTDVDTNRDGKLDAADTSRWVPDFAHPAAALGSVTSGQDVTVDVTSAFQGGPGLYTIALENAATDGSTFSSRTAATPGHRPRLRLEFAGASTTTTPASTTTTRPPSTTTTTRPASTTTTTVPPTSTLDLAPVADTYVEARTEASWDHGLSDHLDVDRSPFGIAYLKFDLRGTTGHVTQATLTVYCSNASPDGGTIYPAADSSWIEGTGTGLDASSAGGPGLKWTDVDRNGDGTVDSRDASPWVPDFSRAIGALGAVASGQFYSVDVTAALQNGPRLYTLAIRNGSTDGTTFGSLQHKTATRRPRLRLVLGP